MIAQCPCGSGRSYLVCCCPRHDGTKPAETAEALMRARYAAFVVGDGAFILATQAPGVSHQSAHSVAAWAKTVRWQGLTILKTTRGGVEDARGTVEFEARYEEGGQPRVQHEVSRFDRVGGEWRYLEGKQRL